MTGPLLLFGAAGQVGCEFMALARARNVDAHGVTRAEADITSPGAVEQVVARTRPRLIVNAAAYTAVDRAEQEPDLAAAVNVGGAENIARAAAHANVAVLHISTDYVFDGSKTGPYVEHDPVAPLGAYGRSKAAGETRVQAANPKAIILRTAWVYGAYGNNFLKTMLRLAASRDRLRVVADQHGCPTSTRDIAEAILAVDRVLADGRLAHGIFHFAGTGTTSWHGFARAIVEYQSDWTHKRPPVDAIPTVEYPTPARRPTNSELDSTLFERTFGYRAKPWPERVRQTIDILLGGEGAQRNAGGIP